MWPSQRLASNDLESAGQGVAQARRRDRRGIRPIVTLLEERLLLSTPGTIQIAPDITPGGNNAVIVNILTDTAPNGQLATINEDVYACPFNIIDTNGVTHTDDALSVDLNATVGTGPANVQPIAIGLSNSASPTWPGYNINFNATQGNQLAWLEQAFTNAKNQPGGATSDQYAALQVEAWTIIDPQFTFAYSSGGGGQADFQANYDTLQYLAGGGSDYQTPAPDCLASFAGTVPYGMAADGITPLSVIPNYSGTLLSLDPAADGTQQYQNLITPADNTLGVYGALPTINVTGYDVTYDGQAHTATGTATAADGTNLNNLLDLSQPTNINATTDVGGFGQFSPESWTFNSPTNPLYNPAYQTVSGAVNIEIDQATPTITITATPGLVYDGLYQALGTGTATGVNGTPLSSSDVNVSWGLNAGTYTSNTATNPNGTPSFWYFSDQSGNYAYESGTVPTNTIAQANASIVVTPTTGLVYNGNPQITATGTVTGINLENYPGALTISATHTDAGVYNNDSWSFTDPNGNYAPQTGTMTDTIDQANATPIVTGYGVTYDGNAHAATGSATVVPADAARGISLNNDFYLNATTHTNAGNFIDAWMFNEPNFQGVPNSHYNPNYASQTGQVTDTIGQANATIVVTPISGLVYNGSPQVTAAYTTLHGVTILDSLNMEIDGDLTINATHTDAGVYNNDNWSFTDPNGNYAPETGKMTDTIAQAPLSVSAVYSTKVYDGTVAVTDGATPIVVGLVGTDTITSTDGIPGLRESFRGRDAGQVGTEVGPDFAVNDGNGGNNYAITINTGPGLITPATANVSVTPISGLVYDRGPQETASYSATGIGGVSLPSSDFTDTTVHTDAGSYSDTWTFTDPNYVTRNGSLTDNIAKATASIVVTPYDVTYDTQAHSATGTAFGLDINLVNDLTITSAHTSAGVYADSWSFNDPGGNFVSQSGSMTDTINQAQATVSVTAIPNLVYNGGPQETASYSATGVGGVSLPSSDFTDTTVHTNAATKSDTWTFTDPNYVTRNGSLTDNIAQVPLYITAKYSTKVYDGNTNVTDGTTPSVSGLVGTDTVTGLTESFTSPNVDNDGAPFLNPTYVNTTFTVNDGNSGNNYTVTLDQGSGTITPESITVTATDASMTYGQGSPTFTSPDAPVGLTVSYTIEGYNGGAPTRSTSGNLTATAGPTANAPGQDIIMPSLSGAGWSNYDVTIVPGSLSVYQDGLYGSFTAANKTYDGTTTATVDATSVADLVGPDVVNLTIGSAAFEDSGTGNEMVIASNYYISGTDAGNYNLVSVSPAVSTISAAPLAITANNASGTYGTTPVLNDVTFSGFVDGQTSSILTTLPTVTTTATANSNVGNYLITASGAVEPNYLISYKPGIYTVDQATATVKVTGYNAVYNSNAHTAMGTVTGVNGIALPSSDLTLSTTHINAGTYQDSWTFSDPNYATQSGTVTDVITKANAIISVQPYNIIYDSAWHNATGSATGVNGPLNGLTVNSAHINAGSYIDSWSFTDSTGNYNNASGQFGDNIAKANATIVVNGYNTFYNATAHAATGTVSGGDLNLGGTIHTNVGTYTDVWTFSDTTGNYNNASGTVVDTITPSKSKMVKETVLVPKTTVVKATVLVPGIKNVKMVERVLVNGKWIKKTVLVPETVMVKKTVLDNETKMTKKTEMVKVYYS